MSTDDFSEDYSEDWAQEAEQRRLQGDALAAVKIAEAGLAQSPEDLRGRIVLALAQIDMGDVLEARDQLASVLQPGGAPSDELSEASVSRLGADLEPGLAPEMAFDLESDLESGQDADLDAGLGSDLEDDELETAFAQAESNPDEMMDANRVVEETLRVAELDVPERGFDIPSNPIYATESMAALLDGQGRRAEADAVRESLGIESPMLAHMNEASEEPGWLGPDHARRLRVVATLEGWLHNLHRNAETDARVQAASSGGGAV